MDWLLPFSFGFAAGGVAFAAVLWGVIARIIIKARKAQVGHLNVGGRDRGNQK